MATDRTAPRLSPSPGGEGRGEGGSIHRPQHPTSNIQHRTWNIEHGTLNWRRVFPPLPGERAGVRAGQVSQPQMDTNEHELCLVARASRPCVSVRTNRNRNSRAGRPCHYGPSEFSRRLRELSQTVVRMNANRYEGWGVTGRRRALPPLPGERAGVRADQILQQRMSFKSAPCKIL